MFVYSSLAFELASLVLGEDFRVDLLFNYFYLFFFSLSHSNTENSEPLTLRSGIRAYSSLFSQFIILSPSLNDIYVHIFNKKYFFHLHPVRDFAVSWIEKKIISPFQQKWGIYN